MIAENAMDNVFAEAGVVELNSRQSDGFFFALLFHPDSRMVLLFAANGEHFTTRPIPHEKAADALAHPFCYLPPVPREEFAGHSVKF